MGILQWCSIWWRNFFDHVPLLMPPTLWDRVFLTQFFFSTQFLCQAMCTLPREPRRDPSNCGLNEHGISLIPVRTHPLANSFDPSSFELQLVLVGSGPSTFILMNVYRPPSQSKSVFIEELLDIISTITASSSNDRLLICGDVNLPGLPGSLNIDVDLQEALESLELHQHVAQPTRGDNILDILATSGTIPLTGISLFHNNNLIYPTIGWSLWVSTSIKVAPIGQMLRANPETSPVINWLVSFVWEVFSNQNYYHHSSNNVDDCLTKSLQMLSSVTLWPWNAPQKGSSQRTGADSPSPYG